MVIKLRAPSGNTKANTPKDWLFRAVLTKAASSCILHANVRKITRANCIPQPDSWLAFLYPKTIKRESLEHRSVSAVLWAPPGNRVDGEVKRKTGGRRKLLRFLSNLLFAPEGLFAPLCMQQSQDLLSFPLSWEKTAKKALPFFTIINSTPCPRSVCWGSSFHLDCRVLSRGVFHSLCSCCCQYFCYQKKSSWPNPGIPVRNLMTVSVPHGAD